jgi:V/A-type H+-transporting ATPase subunit A
MMKVILHLYYKCKEIVARQIPLSRITATGLFEKLIKMKYEVPNDKLEMLDGYIKDIDQQTSLILR